MTQLENAKLVAAFMNEHPEGRLEDWNAAAEEHGMVRFDYSDDVWYRNEEYVVCRKDGMYGIESIDRYEVERKTVWRVLVDGNRFPTGWMGLALHSKMLLPIFTPWRRKALQSLLCHLRRSRS